MKITKTENPTAWCRPAGDLEPGTVVINGKDNLCIVVRQDQDDIVDMKVRLVNLAHGGTYRVSTSTSYEVVDAELVWRHKSAA